MIQNNFVKNLENTETSQALKKQLIHADKILINKIDLATDQQISDIESEIRSFNPLAEISHAEYANADLDYLIKQPEKVGNFLERYY